MADQQPQRRLDHKSLVAVLALAVTMFLLGGSVGYLTLRAAGSATGGHVSGDGSGTAGDGAGEEDAAGPRTMLVRVGTIQREVFVPVRTLIGDLIAVRAATIPTEVAGRVVDLPVDEGSKVVGGSTLLARIDETWTTLDEMKVASQIREKEATLSFQQVELARYENMLQEDAIPLSEVDQVRTIIEELQASLAQLHVLLQEAQERKARLEILAPFDGSVVAKRTEVGEYVPVGSPIVDIISTGRIDARIMVPEESLPLLEPGAQLDVVVDALNLELKGKVYSINAQGSVGSRTFAVRVELDDQNGRLLPGMGVSVFVPIMRESTELLVPRDAVLTKPDGSTVWVVTGQTNDHPDRPLQQQTLAAVPVPVRVLSHTRDAYAIVPAREADRGLLTPGTHVVTEGLERLAPGTAVRIDPDESPLAPVPGMYRTGQQIVERPG